MAVVMPAAPVRADEAVQTRAALIPDGARLVFDWPAPVTFTTTLSGNRLTISFERPLAAAFDSVVQALPGHVTDMQIAGGGQNVVVTLAQPAHVRSFAQGDLVVVDLKPLGGGETATVVAEQPQEPAAETAAAPVQAAPPPQPAQDTPAAVAAQAPQDPPPAPVMVDGVLSVRYGLHDTYDRIVFDWPERVPYTVTNDGGLVTIRFAAGAEIDRERLAGQLPPRRIQLVDVRDGNDGLEVVLAVSPGARVRDFYNFTKTVIDVYRDPNNGAPATVPAAPSTPDQMAAADETLAEPAETEVAAEEPAAAPEPEVAEAAAEDEPTVAEVEVEDSAPAAAPTGAGNQAALLALPPSLGHQPGRNAPAAEQADQQDETEDAAPTPFAEAAADAETPATADGQQHAAAEVTVPPATPTRSALVPSAPLAEAESHADVAPAEPQPAEQQPDVPEQVETEQALAEHTEPDHPEAADAEPTHSETTVAAADHAEGHAGGAGTARLDVVVIEGDFEALMRLRWSEPVRAGVVRRGNRIWIAFDRHAETFDLAAIAGGAGPLYTAPQVLETDGGLVFGVQVGDDVEPRVTAAGNTWYVQMRPRRSESAVALTPERFDDPVLGPAIAFVAADGDAPALDPGTPIEIQDPEVGDRIVIVPLGAPSTGLTESASFVQFNAMVSAQGLAFERLSDDVVVRSQDGRVEVVASGGLILSDDQAWRGTGGVDRSTDHAALDHAAPGQHAAADPAHQATQESRPPAPAMRAGGTGDFRLFDQVSWRDEASGGFAELNRQLQSAAALAVGADARAAARAHFARFLFGYDQFRDAGSLLRMIDSDTPRLLEADASLVALRGAVAYMNGDLDTALRDLSDARLMPSGEAQYWRAATLAALGRYDEAEEVYAARAVAPDWYGPSLQVPLALASVDTALAGGNLDRAAEVLEDLPYFGLDANLAGEIALRRALTAWRDGDREDAEHEWEALTGGAAGGLAARAVFDRTIARYDAGLMTPAEAAEALDDIRFDWRGDRFEYRLLRQLAEYQFAAGDFRSGFRTLKRTRALFGGDQDRIDIDARLQSAFASLFGPEPPASVSPVTAIALFSEFEELAPGGAELDAMLRRLAGRLISIDLYGEAAKVLHAQLLPHMEGPVRGELGRDLAVLYLADGRPQAAIDVLMETRARGFGDALDEQRRQLRASAHLAMEAYDDTLAALEEDDTRSANMLRAETHWRQGDWAAAARDFGRLVEGPGFAWPPQPAGPAPRADEAPVTGLLSAEEAAALDAPADEGDAAEPPSEPATSFAAVATPLSAFAAEQTLNWAMALTYADDQPGLAYLRQRYGQAMAATPYADMFRLLVADDIGPITSVADFGRIGPNIDMFEQFLAGYRERLAADLADPVVDAGEAMGEQAQAEG